MEDSFNDQTYTSFTPNLLENEIDLDTIYIDDEVN